MNDKEGFLGRWSRLKQQREPQPNSEPEAPPGAAEPAAATVNLESLPSLESLGPESDYTPFLQAGVPEELRSRALRQAWASDKTIADFRGLNEYDWDFNAPGYGQLWAVDDVAKLFQRIIGDSQDDPRSEQAVAEAEPLTEAVAERLPLSAHLEAATAEPIAIEQPLPSTEPEPERAIVRRRRQGGAAPV